MRTFWTTFTLESRVERSKHANKQLMEHQPSNKVCLLCLGSYNIDCIAIGLMQGADASCKQ